MYYSLQLGCSSLQQPQSWITYQQIEYNYVKSGVSVTIVISTLLESNARSIECVCVFIIPIYHKATTIQCVL